MRNKIYVFWPASGDKPYLIEPGDVFSDTGTASPYVLECDLKDCEAALDEARSAIIKQKSLVEAAQAREAKLRDEIVIYRSALSAIADACPDGLGGSLGAIRELSIEVLGRLPALVAGEGKEDE